MQSAEKQDHFPLFDPFIFTIIPSLQLFLVFVLSLDFNDCLQVTFQTPFRTPAAAVPPAGAQQHRSPKRFEDIRELDELENWRERATVVTIFDHREYVTIVSDIISDLINNLPLSRYVTMRYHNN